MFIKNYFKEVFSAIRSLLKGMRRTGYYFTIIKKSLPSNIRITGIP